MIFTQMHSFGQQAKLMPPKGFANFPTVSFSPDSKSILTTGSGTFQLWDAQTGTLLIDGNAFEVCYSKAGNRLVSGDGRVWDAETGTLLRDFKNYTNRFSPEKILSPDGNLIFIIDSSSTEVKVFNIETGDLVSSFHEPQKILDAFFSPDGVNILTTSKDTSIFFEKEYYSFSREVKIWDAKKGIILSKLKTPNSLFYKVSLSTDNKKIFTASYKNHFYIWNSETGDLLNELKGDSSLFEDVIFSRDSKTIILQNRDKARVWDIETGKIFENFKNEERLPTRAEFSQDGKKVICRFRDYHIKIWNLTTSELEFAIDNCIDGKFSPDGKSVLLIGLGSIIKTLEIATGKIKVQIKGTFMSFFGSFGYSPNSKLFYYCANNKSFSNNSESIKIWNANNGRVISEIKANVYFSPTAYFDSSQNIIVNYKNYTNSYAKIFNPNTGKLIKSFETNFLKKNNIDGFPGPLFLKVVNSDSLEIVNWMNYHLLYLQGRGFLIDYNFVDRKPGQRSDGLLNWWKVNDCFSSDGSKVFTYKKDSSLQIWNTKTGSLLWGTSTNSLPFKAAFSPSGKKIAIAFAPDIVQIWDIEQNMLLSSVRGWNGLNYQSEIRFDKNEEKIATIVSFNEIKVWEVSSGRLLKHYKVDNARFDWLVFNPNGKKIIALSNGGGGSSARTILFDLTREDFFLDLEGPNSNICYADFSTEDKILVTASTDNLKKIWDAQTGKLLYTYYQIDSADYLVIDPYSRYDGTEAARKKLYFTCGTEVVGLNQVKDQLWVPNLAERIMKGETINAKSLEELNICGLTPELEDRGSNTNEYYFKITPRRGGLGTTSIYINGIEVRKIRPQEMEKTGINYELKINRKELSKYFISGQDNLVAVKAFTSDNSYSSRVLDFYEEKADDIINRPNFYAVMIGVSDYKGEELDLKYAAKDAIDLSNTLSMSARKMFNTDGMEHVFVYNLTTTNDRYQLPEKKSIKNVLQEIGRKATANDILCIFFAGHGIMKEDKKQFYFLTAEASLASANDAVADVGISTSELTEWIKPSNIKAQKRILIFDACKSGQAIRDFVKIGNPGQEYISARNDEKGQEIKAIEKLNEKSGLFIFSASASNQKAYEAGQYSQGILTYSLLKAMKEQPDILQDGKYLDLSRWFNAAEKTVTEISKELGVRQDPQIVSNTNFNIGLVDNEVIASIKLPADKLLFTVSNFQNGDENIADDNLGLNKLINQQFFDISSVETKSKIIFSQATNSLNAYSLSGRYQIKGDDISIKINLKQNDFIKNKYEVQGKRSELKVLASKIIQLAIDWLNDNKGL